MTKLNNVLILLGLLISVGVSIYAAQPWGDNYAYQDVSGYLGLFVWELWISAPFLCLYLLNSHYNNSSAHMKLLLASCLIGSVVVSAIYVESIVFSSSSTGALVFVFMPGYQLMFLLLIWVICLIMSSVRNRALGQLDRKSDAR